MELLSAGRESLEEEAIVLWQTYAEAYRTNIYRYLFLLTWRKEVRRRREKLLSYIPRYILDAYPELPLLKLLDEGAVREELSKMNDSNIRHMIKTTRYELECNHAYRTVSERIRDLTYFLTHANIKPCKLGIDADLGTSSPYFNQRTPRHAGANN